MALPPISMETSRYKIEVLIQAKIEVLIHAKAQMKSVCVWIDTVVKNEGKRCEEGKIPITMNYIHPCYAGE